MLAYQSTGIEDMITRSNANAYMISATSNPITTKIKFNDTPIASITGWGNYNYGAERYDPDTNMLTPVITHIRQIATALDSYGLIDSSKNLIGGIATNVNPITQAKELFIGISYYAITKEDGSVVIWQNNSSGDPSLLSDISDAVALTESLAQGIMLTSGGNAISLPGSDSVFLTDISSIISNNSSFAALKTDGTVVAWGDPINGGLAPEGLMDVIAIIPTSNAFAALKSDGTVEAWGDSAYGGIAPAGLTDVVAIATNPFTFAALKSDGTVVAWGFSVYGADIVPTGLTNVVALISNRFSFTALRGDGTVRSWGNATNGGTTPVGLTNVIAVVSSSRAYTALLSDGTVRSWGSSTFGGVAPVGLTDVVSVSANMYSFTALKSDGTVVSWGNTTNGGSVPTGVFTNVRNILPLNTGYIAVSYEGNEPTITVHPLSNSVPEGSTYTMYVRGIYLPSTSTISYQWAKNGIPIAGAVGNSYTISAMDLSAEGNYTATLSVNNNGTQISVESEVAVITMRAMEVSAPSITSQPSSLSVLDGSSATLSVVASGTAPLSYQWRKAGVAISGATSSSFSILSAGAGNAGDYSVVVSNAYGSATSSTATLTIVYAPTIISQPTSLTITDGASATFEVIASGSSPLRYQWYKGGVSITDASSSIFTITSANVNDTNDYYVIVSNAYGSATSSTATLTVQPLIILGTAPSILLHPTSLTVLDGSSAELSVVASGTAPLSYQWYKGETPITGETESTFIIPAFSTTDIGNYKVVVSNSRGSSTSTTATLSIALPLTLSQILPATQNAVAGARVFFSVSVAGSGPITYSWSKDGAAISAATSSIYTINDVSTNDVGVYTVDVSSPFNQVSSSCSLTVSTATTIDRSTFVSGNIPNNISVNYPGTQFNSATSIQYKGISTGVLDRSSSFAASSSQALSLAGIPTNVERTVMAITPVYGTTTRSVNLEIKLFDSNNNYISDVSNSPVTVDIKMPTTFTASQLNVYRILSTSTLESAGIAYYNASLPARTYRLTLNRFSNFIITEDNLLPNTPIPCFPAGTRVLTSAGFKEVEKLGTTDRLITADGRAVHFTRYYSLLRTTTSENAPYHIPANTFGPQQPTADIVLSPLHAFQSRKGVWQIPCVAARSYPAIQQINIGSPMLYFHLKLPNYLQDNVVIEGGVIAESFGGREYAGKDVYTYSAQIGGFTRKSNITYQNSLQK